MSDGTRNWLVLRTDDTGNTFLVEDTLDEPGARALVATLTARGHKQTYGAISYDGLAERTELLGRLKVRI
jgi:hypothetical protein